MKHLQFYSLLCVLIFTGCSAKIQSVKSTEFDRKIKSIYVLIELKRNSVDFLDGFSSTFQSRMAQNGVTTYLESNDPLSLENEEDLMYRINNSGADVLMIVSQTESALVIDPNPWYVKPHEAGGGIFDIKIFEPGNDRPVWRAKLTSNGGGYVNIGATASMSAEKVADKLIKDGMI